MARDMRAIFFGYSRRVLLPNAVTKPVAPMNDHLQEVLMLLSRTPSADNSQPWRFRVEVSSIVCHSLPPGIGRGLFGPMGHATLLSAGAMAESMKQLFGGAPEIIFSDDGWEIRQSYQSLPDTNGMSARKLMNRHTNRFPYARETVSWRGLSSDDGQLRILTDRRAIEEIGEVVKACSAVRFTCRELHEWLFSSLRWNVHEVALGDGMDIATLHLPPGGRQFMRFVEPWQRMAFFNKFGLYKLMAVIEAGQLSESGGVVAIIGCGDDAGVVEAGKVMLACWLDLNDLGYAVHPYYVVTDIANRLETGRLGSRWRPSTAEAIASLYEILGIDEKAGQRLHMLLRVGKAKSDAPRSVRRPILQLIDNK